MIKSTKSICKKLVLLALVAASILFFPINGQANSSKRANPSISPKTVNIGKAELPDAILQTEEDIQYYAYLNLETAEEAMKAIILEARNKIIFRYSWAADGINARVLDENGNIKEELPHFSDLFPEDWSEPVVNSKVDKDYYRIE